MEPILNSQLPEFSVQAFHNGAFKTVTNNDLKGKWAILFFYPADFTFVCPTELVDMAEKYDQFKAMGVEIYSVSTDSHFVHKAWHDASESIRKIQYPMLADPTGALSRALGVYIEEEGMAYRGTFVVNPEGKIKVVELNAAHGRFPGNLYHLVVAAYRIQYRFLNSRAFGHFLIGYLKPDEVRVERHVGTVLRLRVYIEHPVIGVNPLD